MSVCSLTKYLYYMDMHMIGLEIGLEKKMYAHIKVLKDFLHNLNEYL